MKRFLIQNFDKLYFCPHTHESYISKDLNFFLQSGKYLCCSEYKYTTRKKEIVFSCSICVKEFYKIFSVKGTFKYFFSKIIKCFNVYYLCYDF